MLRDAVLTLSQTCEVISVVARSTQRLQRLQRDVEAVGGCLHPITVDYRDTKALLATLEEASLLHGDIELVVAWIHSVAPEAPSVIAQHVECMKGPIPFFHVRGSAVADPSRLPPANPLLSRKGLSYHEVILGFLLTNRGSRWLTDEEISSGTCEAILEGEPRWVVGAVSPWSARP